MRFLALHVDAFASRVTEPGRSPLVEPVDEAETQTGEALVVLASIEREDEKRVEAVVEAATAEVVALARKLGVSEIVIHPFAHLFAELGPPAVAVAVLDQVADGVRGHGLRVTRTPFGWFNTLEVRAKGHPLSRVARIVPHDGGRRREE